MSKRIPLSKKVRFEVFKRDKFSCQYCGKSAPSVVLEVDHIDPVSKGGSNDIFNLITSCFDCNRGKTDKKLDDDSAITKQKNQLDMLQERREQITLMFNWRKELNKLDDNLASMVVDYIEVKMIPFTLNDSGINKISAITKKYQLSDILEAIDISESKYLKCNSNGEFNKDSVEDYINKIGGILINKNRSPIEQKMSYIKGICRNRFSYWSDKNGSIILNNYVSALKNQNWDDERILDDLENEVMPKAKAAKNWSEWKSVIEKWTEDINDWVAEPEFYELNASELNEFAESLYNEKDNILPAILHIGKVFDNFVADDVKVKIDLLILNYLTALCEYAKQGEDKSNGKISYKQIAYDCGFFNMFQPINSMLTHHLYTGIIAILDEYIEQIDNFFESSEEVEYFEFVIREYQSLTVCTDTQA